MVRFWRLFVHEVLYFFWFSGFLIFCLNAFLFLDFCVILEARRWICVGCCG